MESDNSSNITLIEARDILFAMQRSCEQYATHLSTLLSATKKDGVDLWMEEMLEEATRGVTFHQGQLQQCASLEVRMEHCLANMREAASAMAISDLKGEENEAPFIHPELQKFKLEKQAKILGKYGGVPCLPLGPPPKGTILKATASSAAVEIHYSKVENKDARHLAQVMQFKGTGGQDPSSSSSSNLPTPPPPQSGWQEETLERKGKEFFNELQGTPPPPSALLSNGAASSPYVNELAVKLRERQAALEASSAAAAAAAAQGNVNKGKESDGDQGQNPFSSITLKPAAAAAGVAMGGGSPSGGPSGGPSAPSSALKASATPHEAGGELEEILRRRQERQQQQQ